MSKRAYVVGVDGCPGGWFAVWNRGSELAYHAYKRFADLWDAHNAATLILVDIPIGIPACPAQFPRECDATAQARLGRRSCTVFRVPMEVALAEPDYAKASALHRKLTSRGISRQVHAIREKMSEANSFLADNPKAQIVVAESHPELCFLALRGSPVPIGKKKTEGFSLRLALLKNEDARSADICAEASAEYTRAVVGRDDILDALVLFLAAQQPLVPLTESPAFGLHGLPMRILIPRKA